MNGCYELTFVITFVLTLRVTPNKGLLSVSGKAAFVFSLTLYLWSFWFILLMALSESLSMIYWAPCFRFVNKTFISNLWDNIVKSFKSDPYNFIVIQWSNSEIISTEMIIQNLPLRAEQKRFTNFRGVKSSVTIVRTYLSMRYLNLVHTRTAKREEEPNTVSFCLNIMKGEEGKDIRTTFFVEIVKGKRIF